MRYCPTVLYKRFGMLPNLGVLALHNAAGPDVGVPSRWLPTSEDNLDVKVIKRTDGYFALNTGWRLISLDVFASNQQTPFANQKTLEWLAGANLKSWKISFPPFNRGNNLPHQICKLYNPPVFGYHTTEALMTLFDMDGVKELANTLGIAIPGYAISTFVQNKMHKVKRLIKEMNNRLDCRTGGKNYNAVQLLEKFVNDFKGLTKDSIKTKEEWGNWVSERTVTTDKIPNAWMHKLSFDDVLSNFGFEATAAGELRKTNIVNENQKMVSLEEYSLRWLSKAMTGYNVEGCLTDVAGLVFAMDGDPPAEKLAETDVVDVIKRVRRKIVSKEWDQLWVPSVMVHDAEIDDILAWLLLRYIHFEKGTNLNVLVQLPSGYTDFRLDLFFTMRDCETFRDASSKNAEAIQNATYRNSVA